MKYRNAIAPLVLLLAAGCSSNGGQSGSSTSSSSTASSGNLPTVAFSQANSADPWRQVFDAEIKTEADKHSKDFGFEEQAAEDDPNKQISQIETIMLKSPKVLLVSPTKESVQSAVEKVFDSGIPVVLLDRAIPGNKYTCLIAGDNIDIARQAADFIAKKLNGKGTVLMVQGLGGASATDDRRTGAMNAFGKYPGIKVIQGNDCKFQRQAAQDFVQSMIQGKTQFDAIYAHNDEMAIGSYLAWSRSPNKGKRPIIVGIDGCQKEMIDYIKNGEIDATFKYPIPGPQGIQVAADLLRSKKPASQKIVLPTEIVTKENADKYLAANPNLAK